jgi:hypothetical protein
MLRAAPVSAIVLVITGIMRNPHMVPVLFDVILAERGIPSNHNRFKRYKSSQKETGRQL